MKKLVFTFCLLALCFAGTDLSAQSKVQKPSSEDTKQKVEPTKQKVKPTKGPKGGDMTPAEKAQKMTDKLKNLLNLTAAQEGQVLRINSQAEEKIYLLKLQRDKSQEEVKKQVKDVESNRNSAIRNLLDKDQAAKFDRMLGNQKPAGTPEQRAQAQVNKLDEVVTLEPSQKRNAFAIYAKYAAQIDKAMNSGAVDTDAHRQKVKALKKAQSGEIKALLNPKQLAKWEATRKNKKGGKPGSVGTGKNPTKSPKTTGTDGRGDDMSDTPIKVPKSDKSTVPVKTTKPSTVPTKTSGTTGKTTTKAPKTTGTGKTTKAPGTGDVTTADAPVKAPKNPKAPKMEGNTDKNTKGPKAQGNASTGKVDTNIGGLNSKLNAIKTGRAEVLAKKMTDQLKAPLSLTDGQEKQIYGLNLQGVNNMKEAITSYGANPTKLTKVIGKITKKQNKGIMKLLNADQITKFKDIIAQAKAVAKPVMEDGITR